MRLGVISLSGEGSALCKNLRATTLVCQVLPRDARERQAERPRVASSLQAAANPCHAAGAVHADAHLGRDTMPLVLGALLQLRLLVEIKTGAMRLIGRTNRQALDRHGVAPW